MGFQKIAVPDELVTLPRSGSYTNTLLTRQIRVNKDSHILTPQG